MSLKIGSNIPSLTAQRQLGKATETLASTSERLASGIRINKASDDAAGLAVSTTLSTDTRVYSQALRNISDGVSLLNIADGALAQLTDITTRQMELAEQAANGAYSDEQRRALHSEAFALSKEFNRIVESTSFNGIHLTRSELDVQIQAGSGEQSTIAMRLAENLSREVGSGTLNTPWVGMAATSQDIYSSDFDGDGIVDVIKSNSTTSIAFYKGNGDGTFRAGVTASNHGIGNNRSALSDTNNDGIADLVIQGSNSLAVSIGNGNGTFLAPVTSTINVGTSVLTAVGDFNGDGVEDVITGNSSSTTSQLFLGNSNGTFSAARTFTSSVAVRGQSYDFNRDGFDDYVAGGLGGAMLHISNGDGTFKAGQALLHTSTMHGPSVEIVDLNLDGFMDVVSVGFNGVESALGNGDGTFKAYVRSSEGTVSSGFTVGDINNDGFADAVYVPSANRINIAFGNGDGSFKQVISSASGLATNAGELNVADYNNDGLLDVLAHWTSGPGTTSISLSAATSVTTTKHYNLTTRENALQSLDEIQASLNRITLERGAIGAMQSRYQTAQSITRTTRDGYEEAHSRIMDVDVAEETSKYVRSQILQRVATSILGQANQLPLISLKLLTDT